MDDPSLKQKRDYQNGIDYAVRMKGEKALGKKQTDKITCLA